MHPCPFAFRPILLALLLALVITGCTLQGLQEETGTSWELQPALPEAVERDRLDAVLHVARPGSATAFATRDMAYRQSDYQLRYYARNRWATEPARQIHPQLIAALEAAGPFRDVVTSSVDVRAHHRLETEILRLEQDFREAETGISRLELRARLIDLRESRLLATRRFEARVTSETANAEGGVRAANRALSQVLADLVEWIDETME